MLITKSAN